MVAASTATIILPSERAAFCYYSRREFMVKGENNESNCVRNELDGSFRNVHSRARSRILGEPGSDEQGLQDR